MPSIKETQDIITILRRMTSRELAVVIAVSAMAVGGAFYVENRYAKLRDTQTRIQQQQTEIMQLQNQLIQLINSMPPEQRKDFIERSRATQALRPHSDNYVPQ